MFESLKILRNCNKFLKKYNIKLNPNLHLFKKNGLIHCEVNDTRGVCEVEGFPVLRMIDAVENIIEISVLDYFFKEELDKRDGLEKNYIIEEKYDYRKYIFEESLRIFKNYSEDLYKKMMDKYTNLINLQKQLKWKYNDEKEIFEI